MNYYQPNYGFQNGLNYYPQQAQTFREILNGGIVDSVDVVKAKNCNLDGSASYYPKADRSEVYCKFLNPQTGTGTILTYKLVTEEQTSSSVGIESAIAKLQQEVSEMKNLILDTLTAPSSKGGTK